MTHIREIDKIGKETGMKVSLNNEYEVADFKKRLSGFQDKLDVVITIKEDKDSQTACELSGQITKEELLQFMEERSRVLHLGNQKDTLTGVFNRDYFRKRLQTIDRSGVLPVAVIMFNINDWKFANDHFGDEESDRLIKTVAEAIAEEGRPDYVIGRTDGDVFGVLIPRAEADEAKEYTARVKYRLNTFEDRILAPSVASGAVLKTSIYESIETLWSDAEYNMFEDKYRIKNAAGYRERLEHGL